MILFYVRLIIGGENMINKIYNSMPVFIQNCMISSYGFYLYSQRYKGEFQSLTNQFRENQLKSKEEIKEIQENLLRSLITHSYQNVSYYRKLFDGLNIKPNDIKTIDDLKNLPILTKEIIKDNHEDFIAENYKKKKLIKYPTGGSTGSPLILYTTNQEIQYNFGLYEARVKELFGVKTGDKLATFLGRHIISNEVSPPPFWRKNYFLNQTLYSIYHMSNKNLPLYIKSLRELSPKVIIGYVTPIYSLAKYMILNNIEPIKVGAIMTSSETLHDWQREYIEKAFQCKVCNSYSQAEGVAFISECPEGNLHVQPEFGVCEFISIEGSNLHEIVGTTLFNYAMPLIRYKTNDVVELNENIKCKCGQPFYPIVKKIIGRTDSVIVKKDGRVVNSASLSLIFKNFKKIKECQIIQKDYKTLDVDLVLEDVFDDKEKEKFIGDLKEKVGQEFQINISYVNEIPKTIAGKHRLIINKLS